MELELALTTDELSAAQASVRELSAALETAQARALAERDAVQHELDMERARASALEAKSNRLEEENKMLLENYSVMRTALQEAEAEKQALKGRLAKPFAPMIEVGARSPVRGLRLPKAAAEVPVSPRPTTVLVK